MKLITLILLVFIALSCGPANNPKSRANDGINRTRKDRQAAKPDPNDIEYPKYLKSQMFRTRNADQLTYLDITKLVQEGKLPAWTHMIPNPDRDTDSSVIRAIAPDADCGIGAMNTLSARITDCNTKNPATHLWDSKLSGISGEGDWMLVTKQGNFTLWMDVTTGLIWSDLVQTANWSTASGARGMEATAICRADADNVALGKIPDTQIQWRLPTRSDFLMADINGARFVLPNLDQQYWTASHDGNSSAWSIFQETGILEKESENQVLSVRCVGIVKK